MGARWVTIALLVTGTAACGSGDAAPVTTLDPVCTAWIDVTEAQPLTDFPDDEARGEAFAEFADAVEEAIPAFEGGAAETLELYEAALRAYAADPSSPEAVDGLGEMVAPMSVLTRGIAGICGVDIAEGR